MRAMKWTLFLCLGLIATVFAPAPASADFHPVCTGFATAYANVELLAEYSQEGVLDYHGRVYCPESVVTITTLQIFSIKGDERMLLEEIEGSPCISTLASETCVLRGSIPATDGEYEVRMLFDADDPHTPETEFEDVPRRATFDYLGVGQPVPDCTSIGFFPVYAPPEC